MSTPTAQMTEGNTVDGVLSDVTLGPRIKVCGITDRSELDVLAAESVDFVGLWWGVPGGPHDLPVNEWRSLAQAAAATGSVTPVLVTFAKDVQALAETLEGSPTRWVQLHGYPTPGVIRKLKAIDPEICVIKVLHIKGGECVEASLIGSYEKAGTDLFLFDTVAEDGRVGSTGQSLDPGVVAPLAEQLTKPFLLAGGISSANRDDFEGLASHPLFLGIDVDTNARGADGRIGAEQVGAIATAWRERDA